MKFKDALEEMKKGKKMKLPSWGGYWTYKYADPKDDVAILDATIIMHTKDGDLIDIRNTDRFDYTMQNICSDEWIEATEENCTLLGGTPTFDFSKANEYIKRGIAVKRKGFDEVYVDTKDEPCFAVFTLEDMKAEDWTFA